MAAFKTWYAIQHPMMNATKKIAAFITAVPNRTIVMSSANRSMLGTVVIPVPSLGVFNA
jgi:hypothetical protein